MQVIVADDSAIMRKIVGNMLATVGCSDVLFADGGDIVMELLRDNKDIGLILMDWNMPCMNGVDCLRSIRSNPETAELPVVMVTSEVEKSRILEAIQAGATNYLIKPFDEARFAEVVGKIVNSTNPKHSDTVRLQK